MTETWALIPVKSPEQSKTRLLSVLQPQERVRLSRAMFLDVLGAVAAATAIDRVAVLTSDPDIAGLAEQLGHTVLDDRDDDELCSGLNSAARELEERGATTLVVLPADLPTLKSTDLDELLQRHQSGVSLCPAIRDGGTNALVCSPPAAINFRFGPDSAQRHLDTAAAAGLNTQRLAMPAFFRDIDVADDLLWLSHQDTDTQACRLLRQAGIFARLGPGQTGAIA